jgi:hypothetical protein
MADILIATTENFPFDWANIESYRDSFSFTSTIRVVLVLITKVKTNQ